MSYDRYAQKRQSDWDSVNQQHSPSHHHHYSHDSQHLRRDSDIINYTFYITGGSDNMAESSREMEKKAMGNGSTASATAAPSGKIEFSHYDDVATEKPRLTKKQKMRRHCARFWFCYLIAVIVGLAIGLPILFLYIVPAIAQAIVDSTALPINRAELQAVSNTEVIIGISTSLTVPAGLTVQMDALELWLYNKDTEGFRPFTMVPLEAMSVTGTTDIVVEGVRAGVYDYEELNKWLTRTFYGDTTLISVKANTTAHLGALDSDLDLVKNVEISGLRKLEGVRLEDATVLLPAEEDGTNLRGELMLPNWSILHMGLGNLAINVFAGDVRVGLAHVEDVYLNPGNNTLPFHGEVFLDALLNNIGSVLSSQIEPLTRGVLHLGFTGNASTSATGDHIDYLEEVLNVAYLETEVPIIQLASDIFDSIMNGDLDLGYLIGMVTGAIADSPELTSLLEDFLETLEGIEGSTGGSGDDSETSSSNNSTESSAEISATTSRSAQFKSDALMQIAKSALKGEVNTSALQKAAAAAAPALGLSV